MCSVRNWLFFKLTTSQKLIMLIISIAQFSTWASYSLLGPFFPSEASTRGVSTSAQGIIFGAYALGQVIICPIIGKLIPRFGCRALLACGLLVTGLSNIVFGFMTYIPVEDGTGTTIYTAVAIGVRSLASSGAAATLTTAITIISQHFQEDRMALLAGGFWLPFLTMGVLTIVAGLAALAVIPQHDSSQQTTQDEVSGSLSVRFFLTPRSILMTASVIYCGVAVSVFGPILEPFMRKNFGLVQYQVALQFCILMGGYMLSAPAVSYLISRTKDSKYIMAAGCGLSAVGALMVGPSPIFGFFIYQWWLWISNASLLIFGIGVALSLIPTYDQFINLLDIHNLPNNDHTFGMISGVWNAAYAFGDFLGPVSSGLLYDKIGFRWDLTVYGIVSAAMMVFLALLSLYEHKFKPYGEKEILSVQDDAALPHMQTVSLSQKINPETAPLLSS